MRSQPLLAAILVFAACKVEKKAPPSAAPAVPTKVATVDSLQTPESVLWDAAQDIYFVSNINGGATAKDDNGFISRVRPDGSIEKLKFVEAGKNGVTLNGPKGLALRGDTLWVTDIDAVRAFNAKTGDPIASIDVKGAVFLNDPAFGPDGALYFTDTGIRFDAKGAPQHPGPDRVFKLVGRTVTDAIRDTLEWPNGITWDKANARFVIVAYGGPAIMAWKPGEKTVTQIAHGPGGFDGVEFTNAGRLLVSSWADSTVSAYETGQEVKLITGVPSPADIGYDAKRNRVMVPSFTGNRVEIWQLP